jgi:S1-C subfamily serine protease/antitoxin component YwqK of YwqJK toxin-antitoxin module
MNKTISTLLFFLFITQMSLSQEEKIYYDSDWKVCNKSKAEYYRLITFDENKKPKGKVKDFYITGELQWEGYFSSVDKNDNSKDINEGECIWYYKNGNKSRQSYMENNLENGLTTYWYESGNKLREVDYDNGKLDGNLIVFHESGEIYRKFKYRNDKLESKFFIECDEFGKCQKIFHESFYSNSNNWSLVTNSKDYESEIIEEKGLFMKSKTDNGFRQTIHIPLNLDNDFSIETNVYFKSGAKNYGHGLIWGFKNWDNYDYFKITANGSYKIGAKKEGLYLDFAKWTESNEINKNFKRNRIKILRVNDKVYFSINGRVVHSEEFYSFRGNNIGFNIDGKKEVLFENLIVKQDIDNNSITSTTSNNSDWKSSGTGFFIDKNGYIATNYHVVDEANEIQIEFIRKGVKKSFPAKVVQSDKQNDLSIIKISSSEFIPFLNLPFNFKTNISDVGSNIFALGYPMLDLMGNEIKFTDGKISSKTGIHGDITTYQISVPIQPGNSGGPLFDFDGNLIGITSSGVNRNLFNIENVNYAIKSSYLKNLIDVLDYKLSLPNDKTITNMTLTEKIKKISDYVVLIKVK